MTPMMRQYHKIKKQNPDAFLFYRTGDFYELYNEDAIKGSHLLELALTARNNSAKHKIPMCGVPHKAVGYYVNLLTQRGYKVAICNQIGDPKLAKGMMKRSVVRVITPGTYTDTDVNDAKNNNYLVALNYDKDSKRYGLAYVDLSTGELKVCSLNNDHEVFNEIMKIQTREIVLCHAIGRSLLTKFKKIGITISYQKNIQSRSIIYHLTSKLSDQLEINTVSILLTYVYVTQKRDLSNLRVAVHYTPKQFLGMDYSTRYNLELFRNIRSNKLRGSLLWVLDQTQTAMGGRKLKSWLNRPLVHKDQIEQRQNVVDELLSHPYQRHQIQTLLHKVYDLERLSSKLAYSSVNGKDLIQLRNSLAQIPRIKYILEQLNPKHLSYIYKNLNPVSNVKHLIQVSIVDNPPTSTTDGGIIKSGYNNQLDKYRSVTKNGKQWFRNFQKHERQVTGISNLKVGFNHVFGYFIQVTKANLSRVPKGRYIRKQTLTNSERFTTPELKHYEALVIEAQSKTKNLEYKIFVHVRSLIESDVKYIQQTAQAVSSLDVLQSFATNSADYKWVRPTMTHQHNIRIIKGRHPVVERVIGQKYVPNNVIMDRNTQILLITGPNMSGKSTYMRQLALIVIMAQMGCFIPAQSATLPIFDQIFTRIGASDNLMAGQSTFMVEMQESNKALQNATSNSLILFDELGRGTATYDGMSLAQSIIEYDYKYIHAKTLFSTHYHGLAVLAHKLPHLKNVHIGSKVINGQLKFLYTIEDGAESKSYGIHVAKLAGLPDKVLERSEQIMNQLEKHHNSTSSTKVSSEDQQQMINSAQRYIRTAIKQDKEHLRQELIDAQHELQTDYEHRVSSNDKRVKIFEAENKKMKSMHSALEYIKNINLMSTTPLKAMNILATLKSLIS